MIWFLIINLLVCFHSSLLLSFSLALLLLNFVTLWDSVTRVEWYYLASLRLFWIRKIVWRSLYVFCKTTDLICSHTAYTCLPISGADISKPCYVRVNTLKTDADSALLQLEKQFMVLSATLWHFSEWLMNKILNWKNIRGCYKLSLFVCFVLNRFIRMTW